jgi:hypothetical protein
MGAGDEVPSSLTQLGYTVTLLKPEDITPEKLENFDVCNDRSSLTTL